MKEKLLCFLLLGFMLIGSANAQDRRISGTVTSSVDGSGLSGVSVQAIGARAGTTTDENGQYTLAVPSGASALEFSMVGFTTHRVTLGADNSINVVLQSTTQEIDEVIVTGVAAATSVKKLTVSVTRVSADQIQQANPTSISSALTGKVAGLQSTSTSGVPGASMDMILRGDNNLVNSSSAPLIVIDGIILQGSLADINADDIESIDVVKGAAAAALYGSRAGNGVLAITTKRGNRLAIDQTTLTVRNEYGTLSLPQKFELANAHPYELQSDWEQYKGQYTRYAGVTYPSGYSGSGYHPDLSGNQTVKADGYMDNPFGVVNDLQSLFFQNGTNYTNFIGVSSRSEKSSLYASFENHKTRGIIENAEGYGRQNFRLNYDVNVFPWLKVSTTNLFINRKTHQTGNGSSIFYFILKSPPDVNLLQENFDGQPYYLRTNFFQGEEVNPLYALHKVQPENKTRRWLGNYSANFRFTEWANLDFTQTIEIANSRASTYTPKDMLTTSTAAEYAQQGGVRYTDGGLSKSSSENVSQNTQVTLNLRHEFNDLTVSGRLSYLYEDIHNESFNVSNSQFVIADIPHFSNFERTADKIGNFGQGSSLTQERAQNYFVIASLDYKDRYLFDGMYRYDGSSLFGPESRWNSYYRLSGAYRISEDFPINGIDELKIRAAYGTAGIRPGFSWQYETYNISWGNMSVNQKGNRFLKPSKTTEVEVGLNVDFLNRFSFEAIYSESETTDQFMAVPLIPFLNNGFRSQVTNAGTVKSNAFEATLSGRWISNENFNWHSNLIFSRVRQKITYLPVPSFFYGPTDGGADASFYVREGEVYGAIYGQSFVKTLEQMARQLPEGHSISDYEVNSDGYVVPAGSQGTADEKVIRLKNELGKDVVHKIGDGNPDFRLGIANNFSYKGLNLYVLLDVKQGGSIYNLRKQWLTFSNRNPDMDMTNVPQNQKKTIYYYQSLYNQNNTTEHWVEDASYVKLREVTLGYSLPKSFVTRFTNNTIKGVTLRVIGRNLLTFTKYTGFDPEVGTLRTPHEGTYQYPNFRNISGSLSIDF